MGTINHFHKKLLELAATAIRLEAMKYYASFSANNGSTILSEPYEYTNKAIAIKDIKRIVRGEHFQQPYNRSSYTVWDSNGLIIASGSLNGKGWWSVYEHEIGTKIFED